MNPSFDPLSQGQWGHVLPDQLASAPAPAHGLGASPVQEGDGLEGPHGCQQCGKQYARACDLNKHLKSHVRPFKCPIEVCKYHMFGWPTEKELDRHYNDKHSTEPRVFSCLWPDCPYTSKRESNCKQHMEKTHGWTYVRSRPGNREEGSSKQLDDDSDLSHLASYARTNLTIRTAPGVTFSPSPLEPCLSASHDSPSSSSFNGVIPYGADVCIPWSPPVTRPRDNEGFLEDFTQVYAANTQVANCDDEWLKIPVDPRLYNAALLETQTFEKPSTPQTTPNRGELLKVLPTIVTPKTSPIVNTQVLTPLSEPSPVYVQQRCFEGAGGTPQDAGMDSGQGTSTTWGLRSGNTGRHPHGKRQVQFSKEPNDDSERDDEPPKKRAKAPEGHDDDLGDRHMPCPFRVANPEIYDLNHDPKYYSCHTEHANISTVVRHLGRPAHNLEVDNARQCISSFNVAGNEHGHPKAGLCKKCWRAFSDAEAFKLHINAKCENVSRSKREKFDILLNTFCRIDHSRRQNSADENSDADESGDSEGEAEDVSAKSSRATREGLVSRNEFLALAARLTALERAFSQRMPQATPRIMPAQTDTLVSPSLGPGIQATQPFGHYSFDTGPGLSTTRPAAGTRGIVGGMGPGSVQYGNPAGFNQNPERIMSEFRPPVARTLDNMSTARRTNPMATRQSDSRAGSDQRRPSEPSTRQRQQLEEEEEEEMEEGEKKRGSAAAAAQTLADPRKRSMGRKASPRSRLTSRCGTAGFRPWMPATLC
ncbi:Zinc finger transcription factor ace1 [Cytospora mali]|uniref:Zinc finger transcription factor ace1 n=1 Tax=Cytospora mali TaxID=578113 RepID=A0A194URN1_CYTMA|nr:Zinc finger transcription factor ace1 [Valsa mali var. pyri (nom. inval.)]